MIRIQPIFALCLLFTATGPVACSVSSSNDDCKSDEQDNDGDGECAPTCEAAALSCGANASCTDASGTAECACDAGNQDNDDDGDCAPACDAGALDCGANAVCTDASGTAECECDELNQDKDNDGVCTPTCDTAALECGNFASCDDSSGTAGCVCNRGHQDNDEDGECSPNCSTASLACGSNARCSDADGTAACTCNDGHQDNDGDGDCSPDCANAELTCGANAACTDADGTAACVCDAGNQDNDGDGDCSPDCDNVDFTCGANASCTDADGTAACVCDAGNQDNDGDGDCSPDCDNADLTCGTNASCTDAGGAAACICDEGNQDNDGDGDCSATCDTAELTCGTNATCTDADGTAACACDEGNQDNDNDGNCSATCETAGLDCGDNSACEDSTGTATCVCNEGFQDNDNDGVCAVACSPGGEECGLFGACSDATGTVSCLPLRSDLLAHFDAQDETSLNLDEGNALVRWDDRSGNGHDLLANGTGASLGVDINGRAAVSFADEAGMLSNGVPLETEVTVFAVVQWKTSNRWGSIAHHGHRDTDWALEQNGSSQGRTHFQSSNDNSRVEVMLESDRNYILVGQISGDTRTYTVHSIESGTEIASGTGVSLTAGPKTLYVGRSNINEASNAYIGEFVYYSSALSEDDQRAVTDYLRERWGIYENLVAGRPYFYGLHAPGHDPNFYRDDPHEVHTLGLGEYSTGDLTDGVLGDGETDVQVPSPVVGLGWTGNPGTVATEIVFELPQTAPVFAVWVGTSVRGQNGTFGGVAPDDVDISFSTTGDAAEDFGEATNFPLWDFTADTLGLGHFNRLLTFDATEAEFVKLSFDGGPDGNRYMLDEIRVLGVLPPGGGEN